jgi:ABC-type sulfate transport system permease subunit
MPKARFDLGYKVCTKCSTVSPYGHVHIVEGKTADTIQILPGEVAERANRYAQRSSSGVMKIMADKKY